MGFTDEIQVIMPACDRYIHLLKGNVFLTEHFWKEHPKIHVIGFQDPQIDFPNDRWEFYSMGVDMGKESWSNTLIQWFNLYGDRVGEYFMHMNDDAPPLRRTNHEMLEFMFQYMKSDKTIGRTTLNGTLGYQKTYDGSRNNYSEIDMLDSKYKLGEVPQTSLHRVGLANDIWKTEFFLKYLLPNLSSWGYELRHPTNDGYRVITTAESPPPIVLCHLYRQAGSLNRIWFKSTGHDLELPEDLKQKYIELTGIDKATKFWG